nr:metal tolerance protein 4-like isoform X2 [Ipomoea batatas]
MDMNATLKSFDPRSCIDSLESPSDEVNEDENKKGQANNERAMNISNWANIFLPLKEAHAIGESLQIKIEELTEVESAFVHLDYECDHKPEHSILNASNGGSGAFIWAILYGMAKQQFRVSGVVIQWWG